MTHILLNKGHNKTHLLCLIKNVILPLLFALSKDSFYKLSSLKPE